MKQGLLEQLAGKAPSLWLAGFVAGSAWFGIFWREWPLYPLHWILTAVLLVFLLRIRQEERQNRVPLKVLWPGLLLGLWIAGMAVWRREDVLGGSALVVTLVMILWGRMAYRMGRASRGAGNLPDALLATLGMGLFFGLVGWGFRAWWPDGCTLVNCPPEKIPPFSFTGGWYDSSQWWLHWLLITPTALPSLVLAYRNPYGGKEKMMLILVLGLATISLLPGAPIWALVLVVVWGFSMIYSLGPLARAQDLRPFRHAAILLAGGALAVYGLFPGYLHEAERGAIQGASIRVEMAKGFMGELSSEADTLLEVTLVNTGLVTLFGDGRDEGTLRPMLLISPERGETLVMAAEPLTITDPLAPGRTMETRLSVRLPHWARSGYLAWQVQQNEREVAPDDSGEPGFRFVNRAFRDLTVTGENDLTSLAARAREIHSKATLPEATSERRFSVFNMVGAQFDTLLFSPLWGLGAVDPGLQFVLDGHWPFWPRLLHDYGLVGLALGLWFLVRLIRMARAVAQREVQIAARMNWTLVQPVLMIVILTGLFSPVLGQYHGLWGLFLLAGFVEGRYDQWYRQRRPLAAMPRRGGWLARFGRSGRKPALFSRPARRAQPLRRRR